MRTLDSILPAANRIVHEGGRNVTSSAEGQSASESFDQVIARALSPSETDETTGSAQPESLPMVSGKKTRNAMVIPVHRRQPNQVPHSASDDTGTAAGKASNARVQLLDQSEAQLAESDSANSSANGKGDAATAADDWNEIPVATELPSVTVQLAAVLPSGVLLSPMEEKSLADTKAISTSGRQKNAVEASDANVGKINTGGLQSDTMPKNDLSANELNTSEYPAADLAGLKSPIETTVPSPQPGAFPALDSSEAIRTPAPSETGGRTDGKTNAGGLQSDILPKNDLSANELNMSEYPATDLATLKSAIETTFPSPQPGAAPALDSSEAIRTPAPSETGGTPVAKWIQPMETNGKMNKVAGLAWKTEKVLPDDADSEVAENNLPVADLFSRLSARHESDALVIGLSTKDTQRLSASVQDCVPVSSVVDLRARALERTHDMIALQAVRLVDSRLDSLHVVIKPGAGMQLSLEIRQHADGIDVHAILQRGDFGPLHQHWSELQQRLEPRGVHLAALVGGDSFTANFNSKGFQSPPHEFTNPDLLEASAFAEFALAGRAIQPPMPALAAAGIRHGWETWA